MHNGIPSSPGIPGNTEDENKYKDMVAFLETIDFFPIAKRALECLRLNHTLKFCPDPDKPWVMDPENERLNSTSAIVSLAFEAAMSTCFYLKTMACERERYIQSGEIVVRICCKVEKHQLDGIINDVCKLLHAFNANGQSESGFKEIDDQANRLTKKLRSLFKAELKSFPFDVLALKNFNHLDHQLDPVRTPQWGNDWRRNSPHGTVQIWMDHPNVLHRYIF
ncbi:hypothetical protein BDP27DRAFT_1449143, partial [Rhodocollybia butyracea]